MKKNIKQPETPPYLRASQFSEPKFSKVQKVVAKAHSIIDSIDKTQFKPEDIAKMSYAGGLLESLLMQDDEDEIRESI